MSTRGLWGDITTSDLRGIISVTTRHTVYINHPTLDHGTIAIYESASVLEHVDILYAGVDPLGEPVPAVRASPTAPALDGVTIRYCALDATNFTDINASTIVHNSDFERNRGESARSSRVSATN